MSKRAAINTALEELEKLQERLIALCDEIGSTGTELMGQFDNNDRLSAIVGDMHFQSTEMCSDFSSIVANWRNELNEIDSSLAAAGEQ